MDSNGQFVDKHWSLPLISDTAFSIGPVHSMWRVSDLIAGRDYWSHFIGFAMRPAVPRLTGADGTAHANDMNRKAVGRHPQLPTMVCQGPCHTQCQRVVGLGTIWNLNLTLQITWIILHGTECFFSCQIDRSYPFWPCVNSITPFHSPVAVLPAKHRILFWLAGIRGQITSPTRWRRTPDVQFGIGAAPTKDDTLGF